MLVDRCRRQSRVLLLLLAMPALSSLAATPARGQRASPPAACNCPRDADQNQRWWLWVAGVLGGGFAAAQMRGVPLDSGYVDIGLPETAPPGLTTTMAAPAIGSVIPLAPRSMRVFTANARACPVEELAPPAPRSRRAIEREKTWWRALTPIQRDSVDRVNARRERREREQRKLLCLVLVPAIVPVGVGLKLAVASAAL